MTLAEFLSTGIKAGDRVDVSFACGLSAGVTETTYDGLKSFGIERITRPDEQLEPCFRAPTLWAGAPMNIPLKLIISVNPIHSRNK